MDRPHVVMITHDSWRADHLTSELAPRTLEIAKRGVRFHNAFATGSSTAYSFTGILASNYPSTFGLRVDPTVTMLDEALRQDGHRTSALVENVIILHPYYGYYDNVDHYKFKDFSNDANEHDPDAAFAAHAVEEGFNVSRNPFASAIERTLAFTTRHGLGFAERLAKDVRAQLKSAKKEIDYTAELHESFAAMCLRYLREVPLDKPLFLHAHTVLTHAAFWAPREIAARVGVSEKDLLRAAHVMRKGNATRKDRDIMRRAYRAGVAYADEFTGAMVDILRERGILDETVLVISSDHGEQLYEDGYFGHSKPTQVDDHVLRVPLVMSAPGIAPQEIDAPVSLIDLAPTIAELCGTRAPSEWHGKSMAGALREGRAPAPRPVFTEAWQLQDLLAVRAMADSKMTCVTARDDEFMLKVDSLSGDERRSVYRWRDDPSRRAPITDTPEGIAAAERLSAVLAQRAEEMAKRRRSIAARRQALAALRAPM